MQDDLLRTPPITALTPKGPLRRPPTALLSPSDLLRIPRKTGLAANDALRAFIFCLSLFSFHLSTEAQQSPPAATAQQQAEALLRARPELDAVTFKDSAVGTMHARLMRVKPGGMLVAEKLGPAGLLVRDFPLAGITEVRLHVTRTEQTVLERHDAVAVPLQRAFWDVRSPLLGMAGSNAGDWALALARSLRVVGDAASRAEARALAALVAEKDADTARQQQGEWLRELLDFEKLLATGKPEEIEPAARKALEQSEDGDTELLLAAVPVVARMEFARLKAIEKDNPRWMDDDDIKPERDRHYHLALDMSLHAFLFHSTRATEAAEGLWAAAEIYRYTNQAAQSADCLRDLAFLYPTSPRAVEAQKLIAQTAAPKAATPAQSQPNTDKKPEPTAPAQPTGPPKKYKLFDE